MHHSRVGSIVVLACCTGVLGVGSLCGRAAGQMRVDSTGRVENYSTGGVRTLKYYSLFATAYDSLGNPTTENKNKPVGLYTDAPLTDSVGPVSRSGDVFTARAKTAIQTSTVTTVGNVLVAHTWATEGCSATVEGTFNVGAPMRPEKAYAYSRVFDPNVFVVLPGESSVRFGVTFAAGSHLGAPGDMGGMGVQSSASISGSQSTDLLGAYDDALAGTIFNYSWSLFSAVPGATRFAFSSNPALGINDRAIEAAFLANVSGGGGDFTLANDFIIELTLGGLAPGTEFEFGGETNYDAAAEVLTPAPGTLAIVGIGAVAAGRRRRR